MHNDQPASDLKLYLLGAPTVHLHGQPLTDLPAKTQALLFYLAMTRQPHLRTALAHLLWGELPEKKARANLRKAIRQLRSVLLDYFQSDRQSVTLRVGVTIWVDAATFAEQSANAQETGALQALDDAIQLYRDDFLTGFFVRNAPDFEAWQLAQREQLREQVVGALEALAQQWTARGELAHAIAVTRRLLRLEPWREEAHRQLMTLLARNGERGAALAHFELCRETLQRELDVEPAAETITLYEQIRADKFSFNTEHPAPIIPVAQPYYNLPTPTTLLLGRAAEIAQLLHLFADPNRRLVSIVAPGGMGKSHLAIEVATKLLPHFADGVHFVALAPLSHAETIVPTIAAAVRYRFQNDGRTPKQQLLDYLRAKELLLLLDNAEHLLAGVDLFTEILQTAPKVRLLVTSRERLRLHSETFFALTGLALSGEEDARGSAAELFVQTTQRVHPTFKPSAADWSAIHEICQLVGGMPLGLILAASWTELLSPAEIATEIGRSLDFLAAELHDMPKRHHSLRAVFEATWQRLSAEERTVFQKLAIFQGGFTREAAEYVAAATLATLTALKHKALIQTRSNRRYEIHELLRQFALEALGGQLEDVRDQHSAFYCAFLAQRSNDLKGARQQVVMAEIEVDRENIRLAWHWAVTTEQYEQIIGVLDSLGLFYLWRCRLDEGGTFCRFALEQLPIILPTGNFHGSSKCDRLSHRWNYILRLATYHEMGRKLVW
ncbi:MAG: BTAD domain-containing putative transcriptional regulator [Caldilineaceae bacterium]